MKKIYLLDTNAVSELLKPYPAVQFINKFTENEDRCCISSTTWNELLYGAYALPAGKKRDFCFSQLVDIIQPDLPIIQFDSHAAWIQADLRSRLKQNGIIIDYPDTEIAATAIANQMILITRNTKHFDLLQQLDSTLYIQNWWE
ncbi:MAG: PIN domain-containing protein [Treponema sp.]|nr:PIN domain-containing protein [Treponema sp.]